MALSGSLANIGLGVAVTLHDAFSSGARGIEQRLASLSGNAQEAQRTVTEAVGKITSGLKMAAAGAVIAGALFVPASAFVDFQSRMAEVATLGDYTATQFKGLQESVLGTMTAYGQSAEKAVKSQYDLISAGIDAADAATVMAAANKVAIGSVSDSAVAVDVLTTVLNGYKMKAEDAEKVTDILFNTVKLGKVEFPELADSIGRVVPIASSLGVQFDQTAAAIATMTKQGIKAPEAVTMLKGLMNSILSNQDTMKKMGPEVAKAFSLENLKTKGLQQFLVEVSNSVGGSQEKLQKLLGGNAEALLGMLSLTGQNAAMALSDLKEIQNSSGATEAAFQKVANTLKFQLNQAMSNLQVMLIRLGMLLEPIITPMVMGFNKATQALEFLVRTFPRITQGVLFFAAAISGVLLVLGLATAASGAWTLALAGISYALGTVGITATATFGGIALAILPIVAAVVGVMAAVYLLKQAWDSDFRGIKSSIMPVIEGIQLVWEAVSVLFENFSNGSGQMSAELTEKLEKKGLLNLVVTLFTLGYRVQEFFTATAGVVGVVMEDALASFAPLLDTVGALFRDAYSAVASLWESLGGGAAKSSVATWQELGRYLGMFIGAALRVGIIWGQISFSGVLIPLFVFMRTLRGIIDIVDAVAGAITGRLNLGTALAQIFKGYYEVITAPLIGIVNFVGWIAQQILALFGIQTQLGTIGTRLFEAIISPFTGLISAIGDTLANLTVSIYMWVEEVMGRGGFSALGMRLMQTFADGIVSGVTYLWDGLVAAFDYVMALFPFSDAQAGPFANLTSSGVGLLQAFASGIVSQAGNLKDTLMGVFTGAWDLYKSYLSGVDSLTGGMLSAGANKVMGLAGKAGAYLGIGGGGEQPPANSPLVGSDAAAPFPPNVIPFQPAPANSEALPPAIDRRNQAQEAAIAQPSPVGDSVAMTFLLQQILATLQAQSAGGSGVPIQISLDGQVIANVVADLHKREALREAS